MKPINIYALTRLTEKEELERFERQMSKRHAFLRIREWETDGLRAFMDKLCKHCENAYAFDFYYSFTMPKLGKEFDLLRVNDDYIVNIEIKSREVTEEAIKKQLLINRYYLSTTGRNAFFYTFISDSGRLFRLSNSGRPVEATFDELSSILEKQKDCYTDDIELLFKEDRYLISPLTDPARFLRGEYFLTNQQNDIKRQILKKIRERRNSRDTVPFVAGFTGLPGTGKTILLFDIAMQLSKFNKVCVFHMGAHEKELEQLDERLKRIDFYYFEDKEKLSGIQPYSAIFVDEGHRMKEGDVAYILDLAKQWDAPVIFSYDSEDPVCSKERDDSGYVHLSGIEGFTEYRLTNRIRLNLELSSFIKCVMFAASPTRRRDYPSVSVAFGKGEETEYLIKKYIDEGQVYIYDRTLKQPDLGLVFKEAAPALMATECIEVQDATCKEFDKIVMLLDDSFTYDEAGYLRSAAGKDRIVRNLFHGLSRAKQQITLVVRDNKYVFDVLLYILQGLKINEKNAKKH